MMTDPVTYLRHRNPLTLQQLESRSDYCPPLPLAEQITSRHSESRMRPQYRRRRLLSLAVPVTAIAAAAFVVVGPWGSSSNTAAATLDQLANVAASETRALDANHVLLLTTTESIATTFAGRHGGFVGFQTQHVAIRVTADGLASETTTTSPLRFPGSRDRARWIAADRPDAIPTGTHTDTRRVTPPAQPFDGIEPNVTAMRAHLDTLSRQQSQPQPVGALIVATGILRQPNVNPETRTSLYRALAEVDGLSVSHGRTTPEGHPTAIISAESDHSGAPTRYELIFDRTTGRLTTSRQTLLTDQSWVDAQAPIVMNEFTIEYFEIRPS